MDLEVAIERFELARTFAISRGAKREAVVVVARVTDGDLTGWGEAVPYGRDGETAEGVARLIRSIQMPVTRAALQDLLPPGAARNALDCALWDLEAQQADRSLLAEVVASPTAFTLSLGPPEVMAQSAAQARGYGALKLKLAGEGDFERVAAVRAAAPDQDLIVDANEGWRVEDYVRLVPAFEQLGVTLIEQPFPEGADDVLETLTRPIPVAADESFHHRGGLDALQGLYDVLNVKLDKTGGLTEAFASVEAARAMEFEVMLGCMVCTSLSIAAALPLMGHARFVDLDGPLWLSADRVPGVRFENGQVQAPRRGFWGGPR